MGQCMPLKKGFIVSVRGGFATLFFLLSASAAGGAWCPGGRPRSPPRARESDSGRGWPDENVPSWANGALVGCRDHDAEGASASPLPQPVRGNVVRAGNVFRATGLGEGGREKALPGQQGRARQNPLPKDFPQSRAGRGSVALAGGKPQNTPRTQDRRFPPPR